LESIIVHGNDSDFVTKCVLCPLFDKSLRVAPGSSSSLNRETGQFDCTTLVTESRNKRKATITRLVTGVLSPALLTQIDNTTRQLPCQSNLESLE
jgi:hypothetical protein